MRPSSLTSNLKRSAKIAAGLLGLSLDRHVAKSEILQLIERLHPVVTDKNLIRLGAESDGGYLVPDDLSGIVACFSPGVDVKASFERDMISRQIRCYLADASVNGPPFTHELINFEKKFLGLVCDETTISLDAWVMRAGIPDGDLLLQMDIEGAEWSVLQNVSDDVLDRFRIIVVEFHSLDSMIDEFAYSVICAVFNRLLKKFHLVHHHPNNNRRSHSAKGIEIPRDSEITFLRRDRSESRGFAKKFPHRLDRKNAPDWPDLPLPRSWYNQVTNAR